MIIQKDCFSVAEAAKICGLSKRAFYMHYYRGHIMPEDIKTHKLYFNIAEIDKFRANYIVIN